MGELRLFRQTGDLKGDRGTGAAGWRDALPGRPQPSACEHRAVSKDGRVICAKIVQGDPEVSPTICRACPFRLVDCAHLRFSLRASKPSPLVVRFNGRTEIWDDGPARLAFERAACTRKLVPIQEPRACADCPHRQSLGASCPSATAKPIVAAGGKVVAFPARENLAAAG